MADKKPIEETFQEWDEYDRRWDRRLERIRGLGVAIAALVLGWAFGYAHHASVERRPHSQVARPLPTPVECRGDFLKCVPTLP